ncbi:MAG: hypothetical protein GYA15_11560 [Leptolinea sp.]|nr:hypothetical protein [Leptolinea sp.]
MKGDDHEKENFTSMNRSEEVGGDQANFTYLAQSLRAFLETAKWEIESLPFHRLPRGIPLPAGASLRGH